MPSRAVKKVKRKRSYSKKVKLLAPLPKGIGVVCSITYHGTLLEQWFTKAVQKADKGISIIDYLPDPPSYDHEKLISAVQEFNDDPAVGLIVTIGGVVSAMAAVSSAMKPWIAVIGGIAGSFPNVSSSAADRNKFWGGVSLETFKQNDVRITALKKKMAGLQDSDICLLYNPNSDVSAQEKLLWTGATPIPMGVNEGENDANYFQSGFDNIPTNVKAVIISADPFFQDHMQVLIAAANSWASGDSTNRRICYPLGDYKNRGAKYNRTFHGPSLQDAYTKLGTMAATLIDTPTPGSLYQYPLTADDADHDGT